MCTVCTHSFRASLSILETCQPLSTDFRIRNLPWLFCMLHSVLYVYSLALYLYTLGTINGVIATDVLHPSTITMQYLALDERKLNLGFNESEIYAND